MNTNMSENHIFYLCRKEVEQACAEIDSVAIIREVIGLHGSKQTVLPDEAYLGWTNNKGEQVRSLNMPAYIGGSFNMAGTKIINGNIDNSKRGLPRASGVTLLYDDTSVRILCVMEGAYLSSLRTACITALSADLLAGQQLQCIAIIGAGALALAHIDLLVKRLPHLQQIQLFDIDKERIQHLQEQRAGFLRENGVVLRIGASVKEAISSAQLVIPVTTTTVGYIPFSWLQPGALLVNVSLDDPLPEVVFKANKVIVDDWNLVKSDTKRLLGRMYRQGQIRGPHDAAVQPRSGQRQIDAELGEIVCGTKPGRVTQGEIILVNPFGLAIEDVALSTHVYRMAHQLNIGTWLPR